MNIMLEAGERLEDADLALIVEVVADLPGYVRRGLEFVFGQMGSDPASLGLTVDDLDKWSNADVSFGEFLVDFFLAN